MLKFYAVENILRAISDSTRRVIVERLGRSPASVSELARPFDISLAAIVQHIQVLEEAGIVQSEKVGRVRTCRLVPQGMDALILWIEAQRSPAEKKLDRLGEFLGEADERPGADVRKREKLK
jgi:DNA-binding transcriptional ArsR family regulator